MNPDVLYLETYTRVLPMCLARSSSPEDAVREAHKLSALAQSLIQESAQPTAEPAKRGPGRPRKETVNE